MWFSLGNEHGEAANDVAQCVGIISLVTFVQLTTLTHVPLQPRELTFPAYINVVNPPIDAEYIIYICITT